MEIIKEVFGPIENNKKYYVFVYDDKIEEDGIWYEIDEELYMFIGYNIGELFHNGNNGNKISLCVKLKKFNLLFRFNKIQKLKEKMLYNIVLKHSF